MPVYGDKGLLGTALPNTGSTNPAADFELSFAPPTLLLSFYYCYSSSKNYTLDSPIPCPLAMTGFSGCRHLQTVERAMEDTDHARNMLRMEVRTEIIGLPTEQICMAYLLYT
jgi:hypothetical protein